MVAAGKERPPQGRPVLDGQVALGDGQQAGGARLGREQVVERGVQLLLVHPVANVQQVPAGVVQKPEVGLPGQGIQRLCQPHEAPRGLGCAAVVCGLLVAVHRLQRSQVVGQQPQQFVLRRGRAVHDGRVAWLGHAAQFVLRLRQQRAKRSGLRLVRRVRQTHSQQTAQGGRGQHPAQARVVDAQPGLQSSQRGADGLRTRQR